MKRSLTVLSVTLVALWALPSVAPHAFASLPGLGPQDARAAGAKTVTVPAGAGTSAIKSCVARAVADGAGTTLVFPAGTFTYSGTFTVPDGINVRGAGIWAGGRGTWLQCQGMRWGSGLTVSKLLVGTSAPGVVYRPVSRGSATAGADTKSHGSHGVTFSFVRFRGGSDGKTVSSLLDLGCNFTGSWTSRVNTTDMIATTFSDCEFETPTGASHATSSGGCINLWWDCRKGGAQLHNVLFQRCHFGVKNPKGETGQGNTTLVQPAPSCADAGPTTGGGSNVTSKNWNPSFKWGQIDHGAHDIAFRDCLFEAARWYPADFCDYQRTYSMWRGTYDLVHHLNGYTGFTGASQLGVFNGAQARDDGGSQEGWGNPPGAKYTQIPLADCLDRVALTRVYWKGIAGSARPRSVIGEVGRDFTVTGCYCGSGSAFSQAGRCGNVVSGAFSNAARPHTALFPSDWSGSGSAYTRSPNDP